MNPQLGDTAQDDALVTAATIPTSRTSADVILATVAELAPSIAARSEEIEQARRLPQDLVDADHCRLLSDVGTAQPWRRRRSGSDAHPDDRGTRTGRRIGRMDGDDRLPRSCDVRQAAARDVRRPLRRRPRRDRGRHVQPDRHGHTDGRRLPGLGSMVLRQRLPTRALAPRPQHRRRRPRPADADDGALTRRRRDQRHVDGLRPARHRQPRLRRRRTCSYRPTAASPSSTRHASTSRCCASRSCRTPRSRSPPWPSASPAGRSRTSRCSPPAKSPHSRTRRWRPTRYSNISSARPTPACRAARTLLYHDAEEAWAAAIAGVPFTTEHRARIRATTTWATQTGGIGRRHGLHRGRQQLDLLHQFPCSAACVTSTP